MSPILPIAMTVPSASVRASSSVGACGGVARSRRGSRGGGHLRPHGVALAHEGGGASLARDLGAHGVNVNCVSPGWVDTDMTAEDLKGLRMRFFGLGGKTLEKLGVSVSLLPGGEIFPALEKGALDGSEFSMPAIDQRLGFYKVAKYNYFPGWHQQPTFLDLMINGKVWRAMTDQQRALIKMACMANLTNTLAHTEAIQGAVIRENIEKRGVKNMYWSDEMLAKYKAAWEEVAAEMTAKHPQFKEAYEDLQAFRKDYAYWSALGFLPRAKPNK